MFDLNQSPTYNKNVYVSPNYGFGNKYKNKNKYMENTYLKSDHQSLTQGFGNNLKNTDTYVKGFDHQNQHNTLDNKYKNNNLADGETKESPGYASGNNSTTHNLAISYMNKNGDANQHQGYMFDNNYIHIFNDLANRYTNQNKSKGYVFHNNYENVDEEAGSYTKQNSQHNKSHVYINNNYVNVYNKLENRYRTQNQSGGDTHGNNYKNMYKFVNSKVSIRQNHSQRMGYKGKYYLSKFGARQRKHGKQYTYPYYIKVSGNKGAYTLKIESKGTSKVENNGKNIDIDDEPSLDKAEVNGKEKQSSGESEESIQVHSIQMPGVSPQVVST